MLFIIIKCQDVVFKEGSSKIVYNQIVPLLCFLITILFYLIILLFKIIHNQFRNFRINKPFFLIIYFVEICNLA